MVQLSAVNKGKADCFYVSQNAGKAGTSWTVPRSCCFWSTTLQFSKSFGFWSFTGEGTPVTHNFSDLRSKLDQPQARFGWLFTHLICNGLQRLLLRKETTCKA
jgi:hypothetical protein